MTIENNIKTTSDTLYDMRKSIEKEKKKNLDDIFRVE
jgi:hypothetical protein